MTGLAPTLQQRKGQECGNPPRIFDGPDERAVHQPIGFGGNMSYAPDGLRISRSSLS